MTMKTAILKIHNPSNHKKAVMDYSFKQYTLAFDFLLKLAKDKIHEVEGGSYNGKLSTMSISKYLGEISGNLIHFHINGSLRESLLADVAGILCSYLELKKMDDKTSYPTVRRQINHREVFYLEALSRLKISTELVEENAARDDLLKVKKGQYMPMFFSRPDGIVRRRNFGILYDNDKNNYFASLYLLPDDSNRKKSIHGESKLSAIHPMEKILKPSKRKVCYILVPLAFGKWQENNFLKYAIENPKSIRTAILKKRDEEYYLNVTFDFPAEKREVQTYLGIDRGINKFVALTVIDINGNVLYQEEFSGKKYECFQDAMFVKLQNEQRTGKSYFKRYYKVNDSLIHIIANKIASLAIQYSSQVVLEDLTYLSKGGFKRKTGNKKLDRLMNRKLGRNPYNKLKRILEYKLPLLGLSEPKLVPSHYTSQTCSMCNHIDKANRPPHRVATFICVKCGFKVNADVNASIVIARRGTWWKKGVVRKVNDKYIGRYGSISVLGDSYKEVIKELQSQVRFT